MPLTQSEADSLIALAKVFENDDPLIIGDAAIDFTRRLVSEDRREIFMLDMWRGSLNLSKYKIQLRGREITPLVRVDVAGAPHTNPDDSVVECPHIHLYREGYEDEWAFPLKDFPFRDPDDIVVTFEDFARFCNIQSFPNIQWRTK
jgi:hypothetical protein